MANVQAPPASRKMHDLTDQIVLITGIGCIGAGWGNGIAIATLFARQGAILFGCDLSLEAANTAKAQIISDTPTADVTVMQADATSSTSVKDFVDACIAKHGRIDILVNNVGRSEPGDPATITEETWDKQMDVNLKSVYLTSHLVLPIMASQKTGGNIVNISSVSGLRYIGKPQVAYSTTKAAILSFTRTTAVIYADKGVRLNTVVPGLINTPLVKMLADKYAGGDYEGYCEVRDKQVPMGKMGTAWDVANAALFLASKEAAYITGTEIVVDGGLTQSTGRT
ncbi:NAD(P)-binding Rossmann-fold containing protein [Glarea lozoyensis ATCC 20868]|uniref:NAD(P)-binding Rossmann-fold containing protein n=1 Tax=Glarea lozoyensis (strain ATCC 20868 / MF5171) TaxID=1116229 RepID=S3D9F0_GLAL2|nr:NAD(P)-binding Rossmann-fold containing protein [Glarea lozoyensis ATCC 20868]EPE28621.1 NAD(P)-binding Rossmann-fold containing protein [Glarea lozoyensis ATCC 20868]